MGMRLRPDLQASSFEEGGGKESVIIKDPVSDKFFRLSHYEYRLLRTLDGNVGIREAVESLKASGYYYSPEDAETIASKAAQAGLILGTKVGTAEFQTLLRDRARKSEREQRYSSVFFMFIPLLNPDRFLERTLWIFKLVFNRRLAIPLGVASLGAVYLFFKGYSRLDLQYLFFFNFENFMYLWVTIALTKFFHEFAHAYTAKSFGLHVPQMGVAFLVFFPCLFCNTTDAWKLADRERRIAIGVAGITAEIILAVFATYVWFFSKPGIVNSLAFYLMAVASISTILVNGNPLIKFDGYYVLSDILRIPNLMQKARGHVKYLFQNRALGIEQVPRISETLRESIIFTLQGVGQFFYRMILYGAIVLGVYYRFDKIVGIILAALAFSLFVIRPMVKGAVDLYSKRKLIKPRPVGTVVLIAAVAAVVVALFFPITFKSSYPCYLVSARVQRLTIPLLTWVTQVNVREGSRVAKGDVILGLDTNRLQRAILKKENEREIIEREAEMLLVDDNKRARAGAKRAELREVDHAMRYIKEDLKTATGGITTPFDAVVTKLDHRVREGFQPGQGAIIGELRSVSNVLVHSLIPEDDVHKVHEGQSVEIWFPVGNGVSLSGMIQAVRPYHERNLKESPFSSRFGGEVATEVLGKNQRDAPIEATYLCVVALLGNEVKIPLGMRGKLFVPSKPRSIARTIWEGAVRTFNRESLL